MSPAEWWGSCDAFPGGRQVPGWNSAVTAGDVDPVMVDGFSSLGC